MGNGDPRAIFKLFDMSGLPEGIPTSYIGVVGQAPSGRMWEGQPYAAKDKEAFLEEYSAGLDYSYDILCCAHAMDNGANIVFHRIGHCTNPADRSTLDILPASVLLPDRGGQPTHGATQSGVGPFSFTPQIPGRATGTEVGPFAFTQDVNDKFKLRVGTTGAWGPEQTVTLVSGVGQSVVDQLNQQTNGLNFSVVNNKIHYEATDPSHDVEILPVMGDAYSQLGFVEGVAAHTPGTDTLVISIDSGADQTFAMVAAHGETGAFTLTSMEAVAQLAGLSGALRSGSGGRVSITSNTTGTGSSVQVKSSSTAVMGFDNAVHAGVAGGVKHPFKFELIGPGAYGNGGKIRFYDSPLNAGMAMNVRITIPGKTEEYFKDLVHDPASPRNWFNYINAHSKLGRVTIVDTPNAAPYDWPALNSDGYVLSGGDDGTVVLQDADWVGDAQARTGLYVTDHWMMPFIDITIFGTTSAVVFTELQAFIASRKGRFGWMPEPPGTDYLDQIAWRMGDPEHGYSHAAFDEYDCATEKGYFTVFDNRNNAQVEIPALASLMGNICRMDAAHGRHWSPFGVQAGPTTGVLGIDDNPSENSGEADLLAEYQINNARILRTSIENRGNEGAYHWGGWTLQRALSHLREVPIVRNIKYWEWMLYPILQQYLNKPNHPIIWREVYRTLEPIFRHELQNGSVFGYIIICDQDAYFTADGTLKGAALNTGWDIDHGDYRCRVLVQPVPQIFYLTLELGIMRTGDPWANYSTMYSLPGWVRQAA
jgi:hypothetical protein